jgi:hypothetical protein
MLRRYLPFLVLIAVVFGAATAAWRFDDSAEAAGPHRIIVPNLAGDSAPPRAQPTPTPTPTPTGGAPNGTPNGPELWVLITLTIAAREPAIIAAGLPPVQIFASARARLPTALSGPITVTGTVTVSQHPETLGPCRWPRTFTKPDFRMTVYHSGDLSILAGVDGPEWYYIIECFDPDRGWVPVTRFPEFGVEGIQYYLQYALAAYRTAEGVRLPTQVYTGYPSGAVGCLKRSAVLNQTAFNADVEVEIWVYQPGYPGGCLLPLLP